MSEKQQATNKWENYERYYHYSPLKHFQKILKDKYINTTESLSLIHISEPTRPY